MSLRNLDRYVRDMRDDLKDLQVVEDITEKYVQYRDDPVGFVHDVLKVETVWDYQQDILNDSCTHDRVAWRAGHGVGKSTLLSWIVSWWLLTRPFSRVIILAPAFKRQVGKYLLPEVRKWLRNAKNNGIDLPLIVKAETVEVIGHNKDWFALAVQASDPGKVEGGHNESLCVLADEAKALSAEVIEALHGTQTDVGGDRLYFMVSVPGPTSGPFYDTFRKGSGLWKLHHTSCVNSKQVSEQWVEERKKEWGENSPVYQARVLGEFPEDEEGQLLRLSDLEAAQDRIIDKPDPEDPEAPHWEKRLGVDVARFGTDKSAVAVWNGPILERVERRQGMNTMEVAAWVASLANREKADAVYVDESGIGAGVVDRLDQMRLDCDLISFVASGTPHDTELYLNRRAEQYWTFREAVERGEIQLPLNDDQLIAELSAILYEYSARGKIKIEEKKETKKRVGHSPDLADAAVIGYEASGADFLLHFDDAFV